MTSKTTSTMYELMRRSELEDEDGMDICDAQAKETTDEAQKFKQKYKEFYSDVKTDVQEDW